LLQMEAILSGDFGQKLYGWIRCRYSLLRTVFDRGGRSTRSWYPLVCAWVGTRHCPKLYYGIWLLIASKLHRSHGLNHFSQLRVLSLSMSGQHALVKQAPKLFSSKFDWGGSHACIQVQYADIPPPQLKASSTKAIEAGRRCTWAPTLLQNSHADPDPPICNKKKSIYTP
jgi:hypothetical protein